MPAASATPVLFDAVLFDLDGTLVATELFWVEAARKGAARAFDELGLERAMPSAEDWLSMVGLPLEEGFRNVFPELEPGPRARLMARCVEEEEAALRAGGATLMSGARELLAGLRARGLKLGIASNCGRGYLETMMGDLDLAEFIHEGRCLASAGVRTKADMVRDLLETFDTRSAVMVGDRSGDAHAAHAHGVPFVHLEGPIRPRAESVPAEARIASLTELEGVLLRRTEQLGGLLEELAAGPGVGQRFVTLGVGGAPCAGKSLLARDLVRLLTDAGRPARVLELEDWSQVDARGGLEAEGLERLVQGVLAPHRAGQPVSVHGQPVAPDELLILAGDALLHPSLRLALQRVLDLDLDPSAAEVRARSRATAGLEREALEDLRERRLPARAALVRTFDPTGRADRCLSGHDPLAPLGAG